MTDLAPYGLGAMALFALLFRLRFGGVRTRAIIGVALLTLSVLLLWHLNSTLPPGSGTFEEPIRLER